MPDEIVFEFPERETRTALDRLDLQALAEEVQRNRISELMAGTGSMEVTVSFKNVPGAPMRIIRKPGGGLAHGLGGS